MTREPPVSFRSSLETTPLSVEEMVRVPRPLRTRSSLEKMTPSGLVSPSAAKVPVTVRRFSDPWAVVTKTLSAETT